MVLLRHRHEKGNLSSKFGAKSAKYYEKQFYLMKIDAASRLFRKPILKAAVIRLHGSAGKRSSRAGQRNDVPIGNKRTPPNRNQFRGASMRSPASMRCLTAVASCSVIA
ncbi:hypothetical protein NKG60_21410 [Mesorhizobium sp. M1428]|uniref:hypothetical protein n=1 Tax=unclassified Mesorhizobium TaxID=325217 RepID=UPI0033375BBF